MTHLVSVDTASSRKPRASRPRRTSSRPASAGSIMIGSRCPEPADSMTTSGFHATHSGTSPAVAPSSVAASLPATTAHASAAAADIPFHISATATGRGGTSAIASADSHVYAGP